MPVKKLSLVISLLLFLPFKGAAQDTMSFDGFRLFINCDFCDMTYLRDELNYVNHVRDQALSDVMVQVNRVTNGSGGSTYELIFIGQEGYADLHQEFELSTPPTVTSHEVREQLAGRIELGLVPYLARGGMIDQIEVKIEPAGREATPQQVQVDPWNFWIFEVYAEGEMEKETFDQQIDTEAGFSAERVTEEWRIQLRTEMNYFQRRFEDDEQLFKSFRRRHYLWSKVVKSLGPHWSAGLDASLRHDTYDNVDLSYGARAAAEYSIFPYSEVIRREITFSYLIGGRQFNYLEPTIYEKESELLFQQAFQVNLRYRQPWGDIFSRLEVSSYLHDLSKHRVELFGRVNVRVWKGLAVRFGINLDLIRDQLSLPAQDASVEDILLRQRQIATNFALGVGGGISYTFGSAYNNVINTRL